MITKAEAIAYLLPGLCAHCGAELASPGLPCDACGKVPEITGPEAEALLDSATAIASVQQKVLEAEAEALYQAAVAKWLEASEAVHVARLRDRRDAAQKALDGHKAKHQELLDALAEAEAAEDAAAAELAPVAARHADAVAAEHLARKMKHGYDAERQAKRDLEDAKEILDRYQGYLAGAKTEREKAEKPVTTSGARGDQIKKARDDAEAELGNPGQAPMVTAAVIASPLRLLQDGRLDGDSAGLELAGEAGRAICDLTGRTEQIVADARQELLAEQEAAAKGKAVHLRQSRDGVTATQNPHNPSAPRQFHPPAPGTTPNPYPPALTPGWP